MFTFAEIKIGQYEQFSIEDFRRPYGRGDI